MCISSPSNNQPSHAAMPDLHCGAVMSRRWVASVPLAVDMLSGSLLIAMGSKSGGQLVVVARARSAASASISYERRRAAWS